MAKSIDNDEPQVLTQHIDNDAGKVWYDGPRELKPEEFDKAKHELLRLTDIGLKAFYQDRYDWCRIEHAMYQTYPDSIFRLLTTGNGFVNNRVVGKSIFCGCSIMDILKVCFSKEGADFLIEHTYNGFLFWQYI